MFLSLLAVNVGCDPDRPRPGRSWLRNLYRVHQRLCMAFPSAPRKSVDRDFLAPFRPEDFPELRNLADKRPDDVGRETLNNVHAQRSDEQGFLFRIDPGRGGAVAVLVQSGAAPDWDYAFHNAGYLLAAPPQVRSLDPCLTVGERFRFRLLANPTRKKTENRADARKGKRLPVEQFAREACESKNGACPSDAAARLACREKNGICPRMDVARVFYQWLDQKCQRPGMNSQPTGFCLVENSVSIEPGYVHFNKERDGRGKLLRSARYEGLLRVVDPAQLKETLAQGIGPGKAFGFGLLSLARVPV
jgi:CRISPR system Cascade subunit CasE